MQHSDEGEDDEADAAEILEEDMMDAVEDLDIRIDNDVAHGSDEEDDELQLEPLKSSDLQNGAIEGLQQPRKNRKYLRKLRQAQQRQASENAAQKDSVPAKLQETGLGPELKSKVKGPSALRKSRKDSAKQISNRKEEMVSSVKRSNEASNNTTLRKTSDSPQLQKKRKERGKEKQSADVHSKAKKGGLSMIASSHQWAPNPLSLSPAHFLQWQCRLTCPTFTYYNILLWEHTDIVCLRKIALRMHDYVQAKASGLVLSSTIDLNLVSFAFWNDFQRGLL